MTRNWWFAGVVIAALLVGVTPATAAASGSPLGPPALPTSAPFQQCPAVDLDLSCGYLIDITPSGSAVLVDSRTSPYDNYDDDVLVGVQNDSRVPVESIHVGVAGSGSRSFAFDWDGLCNPDGPPVPAGCPFGSAGNAGGYWGPDARLTPDAGTTDSGTVSFPTPLAPGQYTYFSLEAPFAGSIVVGRNQNVVIRTALSDGTKSGARLIDPVPTAIADSATLAGPNVASAGGVVTYTIYSDPTCTHEVARGGAKPVTSGRANQSDAFGANLPTNATYYVQAAYSGDPATNNTPAGTNCGDETVTFGTPPGKVAQRCGCVRLGAYVNRFNTGGVGTTTLEFNFHIEATCARGVGGCSGTIKMVAPGGLEPTGSGKARNGTTGVTVNRSTATLTFACGGPCARTTIYPVMTLQWAAFRTITVKVKRRGRVVKVRRTIPDPPLTRKGRAGKTLKITLVERCKSGVKTVVLKITFDKHGAVDYKKSDLNGDGRPDHRQLTNATGFVRPTRSLQHA